MEGKQSLCGSVCGSRTPRWAEASTAYFLGCSLELLGWGLSDLMCPESSDYFCEPEDCVALSLRHLLWEGSTGPSTGDFQMEYSSGGL